MMKKKTKTLAAMLCAVVAVSAMSGCGGGNPKDVNDPNVLYISAWDSGYGIQWLDNIAKGYMAKHDNVTVKVESTTLKDKAETPITNTTYYDVVLTDYTDLVGASTTTKFAGYDTTFTEITDAVTSKIDGEDVSIADKLNADMLRFSKVGDKFFYLPVQASLWGMTYNYDVLKNYTMPKTSYEMAELCKTLKSDKSIESPIIFSGDTDYWDPMCWTWWAQYDGKTSFDSFWQGRNADGKITIDIFSSLGRLRALEEVESFLTPVNGYCDPDSSGYLYMQAQLRYLQGKYAFMANGSWLENEMKPSFENSGTKMADIRFMDVPVISSLVEKLSFYEEVDEYGEITTEWSKLSAAQKKAYDEKLSAIVAYVDGGKTASAPAGVTEQDIATVEAARNITYLTGMYYAAFIPCYSKKTDLAKDFLKYMFSNEGAQEFLDADCGSVLPIKYNFLSQDEINGMDSTIATLINIFNNKDVIYVDYNANATRLGGLTDFAIRGTFETNFGAKNKADRKSAYQVFQYDYDYYRAGNAWNNILSAAGLD